MYVGTMALRVFYMFLHGRRESFEIFRLKGMFLLLAKVVSPFDDVDIVKSTWADQSAPTWFVKPQTNQCRAPGRRKRPTNSTRNGAGQERINVGRQDGASAPTHHLHSPRPYAES